MKIAILIPLHMFLLASVQSWGEEIPAPVKQTQVLMQKVYGAMEKYGMSDARDDCGAMRKMPEFQALAEQTTEVWETVLDNLKSIAPGSSDQVMLLEAVSTLPPKTYLKAVHKSVELCKNGDIDGGILTTYLMFNDGPNWGFFEVNYNNQAVIEILQTLRTLLVNDSKFVDTIDYILSGRGKESVENNIKYNPDYHDRSISAVLLNRAGGDNSVGNTSSNHKIPSCEARHAGAVSSERSEAFPWYGLSSWLAMILIVLIVAGGIYWFKKRSV